MSESERESEREQEKPEKEKKVKFFRVFHYCQINPFPSSSTSIEMLPRTSRRWLRGALSSLVLVF